MKFKTNYANRPEPFEGEFNSGEKKVQQAGYRPNHVEIANLIMSGERFARHRINADPMSENIERETEDMVLRTEGMDDFDKIDFARREAFKMAQEHKYKIAEKERADKARKEDEQSRSSGDGEDNKKAVEA